MAIICDFEEPENPVVGPSDEAAKKDAVVTEDSQKNVVEAAKEEAKEDNEEEVKTEKEEEKPNKLVPNKGNGLDFENYSWTQFLPEVTVTVPVPQGTKSRSVVCEIKTNSLKVGLKGQPPIVDGELFQSVKVDESFWNIEDQKTLSILLTKQNKMDWWKSLLKGQPEIDIQKAEPEPSKLSDLDLETRSTIEKMMFDQRQKEKGLPTSEEIQNQEMLKKLMEQHPEMAKNFAGGMQNPGGMMNFGGRKMT